MITSLPLWLFAAAIFGMLGLIVVVRGLRMPVNHSKRQQKREKLRQQQIRLGGDEENEQRV